MMRHILTLPFALVLCVTFDANALLITDTYHADKQLFDNQAEGQVFDLTQAGYSPLTDSITHIKLTYDFIEIDPDEDTGESDSREFVIFSSWIFGWREVYADIDSGLTVFEMDWQRNEMCQYFSTDDEGTEYCALNLDLDGRMNAYVTAYTNNLWLNSIQVEIEVDRTTEVPEPKPGLLLLLGLFVMACLRRTTGFNAKS